MQNLLRFQFFNNVACCRKVARAEVYALSTLAERGYGRMLRCATPWEDAAKTLFTTNASWGHTQRMSERFCTAFGKKTKSGKHTFPSPKNVRGVSVEELRKRVGLGYRAGYLKRLAEVAGRPQHWLLKNSAVSGTVDKLREEVSSWPGFGGYATRHLLVLLGYHRFIPVDREVASYLDVDYSKAKNGDIPSLYEAWNNHRFTAYKVRRVLNRKNWIGN